MLGHGLRRALGLRGALVGHHGPEQPARRHKKRDRAGKERERQAHDHLRAEVVHGLGALVGLVERLAFGVVLELGDEAARSFEEGPALLGAIGLVGEADHVVRLDHFPSLHSPSR